MKGTRAIGVLAAAGLLTGCATLRRPLGLSRDPLSAQEHVTLADTYMAQQETSLAVQQYQDAVRKDKHILKAWIALGNIAYADKDWKHAESYFRKALKAAPGDPAASNNLAMVYLAEGKHLDKA